MTRQVLFIDGIGGFRLYRGALFRRLAAHGHAAHYFDAKTFRDDFATIRAQLLAKIGAVAAAGDYVLIGYSFGGVLARAALQALPAHVPRPRHLFLIGSPIEAMHIGRSFRRCWAYRWLTGDCGQVAASTRRMGELAVPALPTTCIYGTRGSRGRLSLAGRGVNDGMVAEAEVAPQRFDDVVPVPVAHPFLPTHRLVLDAVIARLRLDRGTAVRA